MPEQGSELDRVGMFSAARWLGDSPQTVIAAHALASGRCEAWAEGDPGDPRALLVRTHWAPTEPYAFGRDADALVELLLSIRGWNCINVGGSLIETMPETLHRRTRREVRRYGDLYHVLLQRGPRFVHPAARLLTEEDEDLLAAAPPPLGPPERRTARTILREGVCAVAVIDGRIVSRVHAYPALPRHAELGAATAEPFRGRGLNTACASLVIEELLSRRVTPVWSTGDDNAASKRVAEKLGFVPTTPRVYLRLS